jgi:hypothetical protein
MKIEYVDEAGRKAVFDAEDLYDALDKISMWGDINGWQTVMHSPREFFYSREEYLGSYPQGNIFIRQE